MTMPNQTLTHSNQTALLQLPGRRGPINSAQQGTSQRKQSRDTQSGALHMGWALLGGKGPQQAPREITHCLITIHPTSPINLATCP